MPRPGGEADKLGNRYEGLWTVGKILDLAAGTIESITVEPFDESVGIEFIVQRSDGGRDFHSAKRQRSEGEWTMAALARKESTGRSILGDLFHKIEGSEKDCCCFVSSTGANDFRELTERAHARQSAADFEADLKSHSSKRLGKLTAEGLISSTGDWEKAYRLLRRTHVVLIDEASLKRQVEQHISFLIYAPNSPGMDPNEPRNVRLLLGDFTLDRLGDRIERDGVWEFLRTNGYFRRDWARDPEISEAVRRQNDQYVRTVESILINGAQIPRREAQSIVEAVMQDSGARTVLVSAPAGAGKSCVMAQAFEMLTTRRVPTIVVRLDRHGAAHTTQEIGRQMTLPRSPAVVAAGLANGQKAVLIVDQLDAVSQVSGRYPQLWDVFDSFCVEASEYPNLRMVVACRDFDIENDSRLRQLKRSATVSHVKVELLSVGEVNAALEATGYAAASITAKQKEVLCTPLHLLLFLSGLDEEQSCSGVLNVGDLFDRYWERKRRAVILRVGHESDWIPVIDKLCEVMSRELTLYAPAIVLDEHAGTTAGMLTEHVLVRDGSRIRFFHESFFDFAFARRFCAMGENLITFLLQGEQDLFRRSQARQILVYMRDQSRDAYLAQLQKLLAHTEVRFHIKRVVLAWLGSLSDPTADEWSIIEALLPDPDFQRSARPPIRNSLPWCELLLRRNVIKEWLASASETLVRWGLWFLQYDPLQKMRSEECAELLSPYRGQSEAWTNRLRNFFRYGNAHCSRAMQELFLTLVDDGVFDQGAGAARESIWHHLHGTGAREPRFALEVIVHWLDRHMKAASDSEDESSLDVRDFDSYGVRFIGEVAEADPSAFVDVILPWVAKVAELTQRTAGDGLRTDRVWGWISNGAPMRISDALFHELVKALQRLARSSPAVFEDKTSSCEGTEFRTLTVLLLRAWSANPEMFGDRCIDFLSADSRRLEVGYHCWRGGGNGCAAVSREAIQACVSYATKEVRTRLERAMLGLLPKGESRDREEVVCLLLESFGEEYLTDAGKDRLRALRLRFPKQEKRLPPREESKYFGTHGSPIPAEAAREFTDDEWLDAMRKFNYGWESHTRGENGSAVELSRVLRPQARLDRRRFAKLAIEMEDSIRPEYFEAILDGIVGFENLSVDEKEKDNKDFEALGTEVVLSVVRRLHQLPSRPCGRSISRAFERFASRRIEEADLSILVYYAIDDPDPGPDDWSEGTLDGVRDVAEEAHRRGNNSVRGEAAQAIAALLYADFSRSTLLLPVIQKMVHDSSLSARTCAVEALLPVLRHDRDEAVRLFLSACDGADRVFGSHPYENFLRFAAGTHYEQLRGPINRALRSESPMSVKAAGRQICIAAFTDEAAQEDAEAVRIGPELMRLAAAEVYALNLGNNRVGNICREYLPKFFCDDSREVRTAAGECFLNLGDVDWNEFADLIRTYIDSPAFPAEPDGLIRRLDDTTWQLPDVTIRLAERFIEANGAAAGDLSTAAAGDAPTVSKLVIRLYSQSGDQDVRRRCLDLIDQMERLGFYGIDEQLAELDR